jgi:thiamine-phosphate pyrophosphorylase
MKKIPEGIYGITTEKFSLGRSNKDVVEEMIKGGIKIVQYREKEKPMREKYNECMQLRSLTNKHDVLFIINDHVDLALACKADGVHLGQDDLPVSEARALLGNDKIIGVSTHSPAQAQKAQDDGADYIGAGPIFRTSTKEDVCAPVGLEYLDYVAKNINIPFVAIGGIKEHNIKSIIEKGARRIALVTEIVGAENISEKVNRLSTGFWDAYL